MVERCSPDLLWRRQRALPGTLSQSSSALPVLFLPASSLAMVVWHHPHWMVPLMAWLKTCMLGHWSWSPLPHAHPPPPHTYMSTDFRHHHHHHRVDPHRSHLEPLPS